MESQIPRPKTLAAKLCAIMEACKNIPKNGHNKHFNYKFVKAADAAEYIRHKMAEEGVISLPKVLQWDVRPFKTSGGNENFLTTVVMGYTFINAEDHTDREEVSMLGQGSDAADKGSYKANTGVHKYFLMQSFNLGSDDDPEKTEADRKKKAPAPPPQPAPQSGKKPKDLNAEQLEWLRHNGKTPEQRQAAEAEISRREELEFNNGGN